MSRIDDLRRQIRQLTDEVRAIDDLNTFKANRGVLGKCYRVTPDHTAASYMRVLGLTQDGYLKVVSFEAGESLIAIRLITHFYANDFSEDRCKTEINEAEFQIAWAEFTAKVCNAQILPDANLLLAAANPPPF